MICALLLLEAEARSSSVSVVYVVRLRIVFLKAALKKRDSMEHMEPLWMPYASEMRVNCGSGALGHHRCA